MENKTINRGDWSGNEITYKFGARTIIIDTDNKYTIKKIGEEIFRVFRVHKNSEDHHFITIYKFRDEYISELFGVERSSKNIDEVIVQMHCNLV